MTKFIFLNSITKNQTLSQLLDKEELDQFIEKMTDYEYESYKYDDFNFDSEIAFSEYESEKNMLTTISNQFKNLSEEDKILYNRAIAQSNATDNTKTKLGELLIFYPTEILNELLTKTKFHDGIIKIDNQILNTKMSKLTENEPKFLTYVSNYIFDDILGTASMCKKPYVKENSANVYADNFNLNYAFTDNQIIDFLNTPKEKQEIFASAFSKNLAINIFNKTLKEVLGNHFTLELLNTFFDNIQFIE